IPELNSVLRDLITSVQTVLGENFVAAYLQGSFAIGDFDNDSDVDFLVVVEDEASDDQAAALRAIHAGFCDRDSYWARHLEGSYFPKATLRRFDPTRSPPLYVDNGSRELVRSDHDNTLVVRWALREYGITLAGPDAHTLIDPVPASELRQEVSATMRRWAEMIFAEPEQMNNRWYQPFAVLSYCRMLHTLHTGRVGSKPAGAEWAAGALDSRWSGLIQRARQERPDQYLKIHQPADAADFNSTLEFIKYALDVSRQYETTKL
ncbi:MAG TPA: aminoglycoside adenylyltransferase domain-containing protein, partial [Anaerolineales bacterium]|nr:aminoglycoside adenylyltransferase domain-containing protein [Anaerolineales bacterium]